MKNGKLLLLLGAIPAIWLGLLIAPYLSEGLPGILEGLPAAMNQPYKIVWCEDSGKAALLFLALYGMGVGIYLSTRRHYRKGEEHGSAKWGDARTVNKKYREPDFFSEQDFHPERPYGAGWQKTPAQSEHRGYWWFRCRQNPVLRQTQSHAGQCQFLWCWTPKWGNFCGTPAFC